MTPISHDDFKKFIDAKRKYNCAICGQNNFSFLEDEDTNAIIQLASDKELKEKKLNQKSGLILLSYSCINCGHVYFVARGSVVEWKNSN